MAEDTMISNLMIQRKRLNELKKLGYEPTTELNEYKEFTFFVKAITGAELHKLFLEGFEVKDINYACSTIGITVEKQPIEKLQKRTDPFVKRAFEAITN